MITWFRTAGLRLLLAAGLAFSLWVYVSFRENPNVTSQFQGVLVESESLGPGLVLVDRGGLPVTARQIVNISAEGPETVIQSLRPSDIRAFADLTGFGAGEYQVPVTVSTARTGFARVSFSPDPAFLPFRIEQAITRTVPLTVEVLGSVPFSFEQQAAQISINRQPRTTIEISGPENRVNLVDHVRATANINQLTANYSSPRPVEPVDAGGAIISGVAVLPSTVDVLIPIVSSVGIKRVPVVPQVTGRPVSGQVVSNVSVTPEFVTLTGSSGPLDAVQSIATEPLVITGKSGTFTQTVQLRPPSGVTLLENEPTSVVVEITTRAIAQPFSVTIPVEVVGTNPHGLLVNISPNIVQLKLSGTAEAISAINSTTIQGTVDLANLNAGTYELSPVFNLPKGVALVEPPRVTVSLRAPATAVPATAVPTTAAPTTPAQEPTTEPVPPTATPAPQPTADQSSAGSQPPTAVP